MFYDTVYKIAFDDRFSTQDDQFTWGLPDNTKLPKHLVNKINKGLYILGNPSNTLIPYYKGSFFVFINKNAILYFLYRCCDFSFNELEDLNRYCSLYELKINCISAGVSNIRGTIFNDEVESVKNISFVSLGNDFFDIKENIGTKDEIRFCKESYYNKFNLKVNF